MQSWTECRWEVVGAVSEDDLRLMDTWLHFWDKRAGQSNRMIEVTPEEVHSYFILYLKPSHPSYQLPEQHSAKLSYEII